MKLVLSNVRPNGGEAVDIEITDGKISQIAKANSLKADIDGRGLIALPGLVDLHTHLREPGRRSRRIHRSTRNGEHDSGCRQRWGSRTDLQTWPRIGKL
jgi:dihydroorotase-like cyclic amidohydrolase